MWHVVVVLALLLWMPLVSVIAAALTWRWRLPSESWRWAAILAAAGAGALSLVALLLREPSAVLGGWLPVSAFGAPLALRLTPLSTLLLLSWFVVHLNSALRASAWNHAQLWWLALMSSALGLLAAAGNLLVLLMGIVLSDLVWMWRRSSDAASHVQEALIALALRTVGTTLLVLVFAGHYTTHRSAELGLFPLADELAPVGAVVLGLRLLFAPFARFATLRPDTTQQFALFTTLVLQHRLAEAGWAALPSWFSVWAALSIGQSLTLALGGRARAAHMLPVAAAALSAAVGAHTDSAAQAAVASTWLVGSSLATHVPLRRNSMLDGMRRLVGASALLGLSSLPLWRISGGHVVLGITALGVALLLARSTRTAMRAWRGARFMLPQTHRAPWVLTWAGFLMLVGALVSAGLVMLTSTTLSAPLNPASAAWTFAALGLALGGGGWLQMQLMRRAPSRLRFVQAASQRAIAVADFAVAIAQGALHRLSALPARFFDLLERDGALAWLIVVVLLVVLISRAQSP